RPEFLNEQGLIFGACYESAAVVPDGSPPPAVDDPVTQYVPSARPGWRAPPGWRRRRASTSPRTASASRPGPRLTGSRRTARCWCGPTAMSAGARAASPRSRDRRSPPRSMLFSRGPEAGAVMELWNHCENPYPSVPNEVLEQAESVRASLPNKYCDPKIAARLYDEVFDEYRLCDDIGIHIVTNEHHSGINNLWAASPVITGVVAR